MVDPKETDERTVETEAGLGRAAGRVWVKPRLESSGIAEDTMAGTGNGGDASGGGAGTCVS
jgi:hypothetical protein